MKKLFIALLALSACESRNSNHLSIHAEGEGNSILVVSDGDTVLNIKPKEIPAGNAYYDQLPVVWDTTYYFNGGFEENYFDSATVSYKTRIRRDTFFVIRMVMRSEQVKLKAKVDDQEDDNDYCRAYGIARYNEPDFQDTMVMVRMASIQARTKAWFKKDLSDRVLKASKVAMHGFGDRLHEVRIVPLTGY